MPPPAILVVTGASGTGKTAVVDAIQERALEGIRCYHFDAVGVPSVARMLSEFGSPQAWQVVTTHRWIATLVANRDRARLAILEGQVRPDVVREAFTANAVEHAAVLLLDCAPEVRAGRVRGFAADAERAGPRMDQWAAYLRGQADALGLRVVDTSGLSVAQAADLVVGHALALVNPEPA